MVSVLVHDPGRVNLDVNPNDYQGAARSITGATNGQEQGGPLYFSMLFFMSYLHYTTESITSQYFVKESI